MSPAPLAPYAAVVAVEDKNFGLDMRRRLVACARAHGLQATARTWKCSRNTVRLWAGRCEQEGLKEPSHAR